MSKERESFFETMLVLWGLPAERQRTLNRYQKRSEKKIERTDTEDEGAAIKCPEKKWCKSGIVYGRSWGGKKAKLLPDKKY